MRMWNSEKDFFVRSSTEFALDLLQKLSIQDQNLFVSPYNLSVLLTMVYAGARGDTANQMAAVLHFPADCKTLHDQLADLNDQLLAGSKNGQFVLRIGNRIWSQTGYALLQSFLDIMAIRYKVAVEEVDFSQGERTCRVINDWVKDQTAGVIINLVTQNMFTSETLVILTGATYFKGKWLNPFEKSATREEEFWVSPERTVRTPMMQQEVVVPYAEYSDVQAVALPYHHLGIRNEPDISMVILLPQTRGDLDNISTRLQRIQLERWVDGLKFQKVKIFLPKFRMESSHRLRNLLAELGMGNAFDLKTADFSGMTQARKPLWIDDLLHKAYLNVDEAGTEAAAASGWICLGATMGERPPIPVFKADHPFLFLIRHNPSGIILFIGRVNNPQT
jgi:serpin B